MTWVDAVLAAEPVARRAPSVLNTQPVVLHRGDERIAVCWDPARTLTVLDPDGTHLFMSLGAFIEALTMAAGAAGVGVRTEFSLDSERHRFAVLYPGPLVHSRYSVGELTNRVTGVGRFADPPPSVQEVEYLSEKADLPSGLGVVGWERSTGDPLAERAHRWLFATPEPRRELRSWVRPGAEDGLEPAALGLPAWRAKLFLAARGPLDDSTADLLGGHPRGLGTLAALVDSDPAGEQAGNPARCGMLGAALLRLGLQGIRHGLRLQPLPHVTACPDTAATLALLLESADVPGRVGCVFRVGTPQQEPPLSRRRPTPIVG
ncbi:MAG TPA: hypothetical protein VM429_00510 [Micropruina sp.]|nr:hypothetical protein [Micropruina sp.]